MNQQEEIVAVCANCRFHEPLGSDILNICRRYAPRCNVNFVSSCSWPVVRDSDWCGEFEPYPDESPGREVTEDRRKIDGNAILHSRNRDCRPGDRK